MIKFLNKFFSSTIRKSITSPTKPVNSQITSIPQAREKPLIDESTMLKLSQKTPNFSTFYQEVTKLYPNSMEGKVLLDIQNYVEKWPTKCSLLFFKNFNEKSESIKACELLIKLLISVPKLKSDRHAMYRICQIIRNKNIRPDLLEELKKSLEGVSYTNDNLESLVFIFRALKNVEGLKGISNFINSKNKMSFTKQIIILFNINKEIDLDDEKKSMLLAKKNLFKFLEVNMINRLCDIFLTDKSKFYPEFFEFLEESIGYIVKEANIRELMNIINYLGQNLQYADDKIVKPIYQSLLGTKLILKPMDLATLLHNLRKLSLSVDPFLPLLTEEMIESASEIETAVIFHSIYKYGSGDQIELLKKKIMLNIDRLSPKLILNIAKDLVDDVSSYDREYVDAFESKAEQAFCKYFEPDSIHFRTQLISYYYLRYKRHLQIDSDLEDD